MPLPPDPDSLVEKPKCVHLECYFWLNALEGNLSSLNIGYCGLKMSGNYNGVPLWLIGNQLQSYMPKSSETDLKKTASLK